MADTKISDLSAVTDVQATDEYVLARAGTSYKIDASDLLADAGGGLFDAYAYLREEQSSGTNGGAATSGSFQTIVLNTEVFDTGSFVSLSSNQFTLAAGTYMVRARKTFFRTGFTRIKLRNVTDSSDTLLGDNPNSETTVNAEGTVTAHLFGRFTIAGTKTFELQYRLQTVGGNTKELGCAASYSINEVYAEVEIWREA